MAENEDFIEELECDYKGEHYSVRDNGAIMRHPKEDRKRPADGIWTFGTKSDTNGYMTAMGVRVHIVVATAFHGPNDSKKMVVDHIDTNRCNNRPENLRWLTKLENTLLNPYTKAKIEYICGSVEKFLANPNLLRGHESEDPNFQWMRTVTKEEAANTLEHMKQLVERPKVTLPTGKKIDAWIYQSWQQKKQDSFKKAITFSAPAPSIEEQKPEENYDPMSPTNLNPLVWSRYPYVDLYGFPEHVTENPLQIVYENLTIDSLFSKGSYATYHVVERIIYDNELLLLLHDENAVKSWAFYRVWWDETHYRAEGQMCFQEEGARALYYRAQDIPGYEEDTLDDLCM